VIEDLSEVSRELSNKIVHEVPLTIDDTAEQNFQRGVVSGIERILDFAEELKSWREQNTKK
jgi:hypothetical protein